MEGREQRGALSEVKGREMEEEFCEREPGGWQNLGCK